PYCWIAAAFPGVNSLNMREFTRDRAGTSFATPGARSRVENVPMKRPHLKHVAVLGVAAVLAALGSYNIFLKATWTLMDDGVLWVQGAQGVYAARVAPGGPAAQAGIHANDIVPALDGEEAPTSQETETPT